MTAIRSSLPRVLGLIAAVAVVAGCAGSATTPAPGATGTNGGTVSPGATGAPAGSAVVPGGTAVDACALLTEADIKQITGFEVEKTIPNPPDTVFPSACEWHVRDAAWQVVLGVASPGGQAMWDRLAPYTKGTAIAGIGDEALLTEIAGDLLVRRGDACIDMQYVAAGPETDAIQEELAKRVLEHLR